MQMTDVNPARDEANFNIAPAWQDILNTIPVAAYSCDADGHIIYFNRLAASVWGREPKLRDASERYCGSHQLYLSDGTAISHEQCWMARALAEGTPYHGREIVIERIDGGRTSCMAYSHPVRNVQGDVIGAVNLVVEVGAAALLPGETRTAPPFDAAVAMIEVAVFAFAELPWEPSAFH